MKQRLQSLKKNVKKMSSQPGGSLGDEVIVVMMYKTRAEANDVTE